MPREMPPASSLQPPGSTSSSDTRPAISISAASGISAAKATSWRLRPRSRPAPSSAAIASRPTATASQARRGSLGSSIAIQCSAPQAASAVNASARASATGSSVPPPIWRSTGCGAASVCVTASGGGAVGVSSRAGGAATLMPGTNSIGPDLALGPYAAAGRARSNLRSHPASTQRVHAAPSSAATAAAPLWRPET